MNITKLLPLSMAMVAILGISPPVGAAVALNPLLANKSQVVTPGSGLCNLEIMGRKPVPVSRFGFRQEVFLHLMPGLRPPLGWPPDRRPFWAWGLKRPPHWHAYTISSL